MISQDKGKVTFFPNVAPPFLYQNSLSKGRWDFCLKFAREEGSHKEQLCILSGVWPGTPAIPCFSIQSFTVTEIYVNSFNTNKLKKQHWTDHKAPLLSPQERTHSAGAGCCSSQERGRWKNIFQSCSLRTEELPKWLDPFLGPNGLATEGPGPTATYSTVNPSERFLLSHQFAFPPFKRKKAKKIKFTEWKKILLGK